MPTIVLKDTTPRQLFMGAMLMTNPQFSDSDVAVATDGEISNVTSENMHKYCPSWVNSNLIALAILCNVCEPIIDNKKLTLREKLVSIRDMVISKGIIE